ncbi:MAG: SGNH/GDSL hydrolase family protein [Methylacidiphilales bacterium]|nr:SGNH/GDSL hydrolase family protein [Candidatus Methylacidiphilales bacterium]
MNQIALGLADGTAFFIGIGLLLASVTTTIFSKSRLAQSSANIGCLVSLVVVLLSATPLPAWEYVLLCVFTAGFLLYINQFRNRKHSRRLRAIFAAGVVVVSIAVAVQESLNQLSPVFTMSAHTRIYVVGDSISAGMGRDTVLWPPLLSDMTGLSVSNLALPGANVQSAQEQIAKIPNIPSVVILEIGGNDLLGPSSSEQFRKGLESILDRLHQGRHHILMVELPLYPFKNAFGEAQRDLARKYGVTLIPKRYFTKILGTEGATLDGLHLSPAGHKLFAETIAGILIVR